MHSIYSFTLKHDAQGRITEKNETVKGRSNGWTYAYDKKGRLFEAHLDNRLICQCYYDKQGRRIQDSFPATHGVSTRTFRYTMNNRLQAAGNNGYTHDKQGMRILWNSGGNYTRYEYAPDHHLLRATREWDNTVFEFAHHDNGQRAAKFRDGTLVEAYHWRDFIRLAAFYDGTHEFVFVYRSDERTPHAMRRDDGAVFTLHYDQVGSLRVVADQGGNVIQEVLYDPFGGIIEDTCPGLRIPIGFAGGLHDRDLGFVRFGWRDYDTFTGRWTAPDPLGDAGGDPDWYGYCLDDPVNGVDPLGLFLNWLVQQGAKKVHTVINPMATERIIKEEADKEIARLEKYGNGNATARYRIGNMEKLKKSMDEEGLPSTYRSVQKTLELKRIWPYNKMPDNEDFGK